MQTNQFLKDRRLELGLTQAEIARFVGVSEATVSRWESGDIASMRQNRIAALAEILRVDINWIVSRGAQPVSELLRHSAQNAALLGSIACGTPILAQENIEEYLHIPENIAADFCLRCKGDSMINARIFDGDIVLIREQPDVDNGEIAAVLIDDEATLKRVYKYPNRIELRAENPLFAPLNYEDSELSAIRILGKAVAFLSTVR